MENGLNWEQKALINELTQGMELAKQLRVHLNSTSSAEIRELLLQRILSSYEKALLILKWSGSVQQPQSLALITGVLESSVSGNGSPRSEDIDRGFMDNQDQNEVSKKRKVLPTWTDQVRVCSQNGLEGHIDDGYSWRKYGQKDILGAKYPRSYYRCTYRNTQNCWASKQVQRSDENPTIFEIIYRGRHSCNQTHHTAPAAALASPDKQEVKQNNQHNNHQQQPSQNMLLNFRTSLRVNTEDLVSKEMAMASHFTFPSTLVNDNILGSFSPRFISPATSETNCSSVPPCQMNSFGLVHNFQPSESDLTEIILPDTSTTNSPIMDLNFSIDPVDLDSIFPFNTPGYFD